MASYKFKTEKPETSEKSKPVAIPQDFLTGPAPGPIEAVPIDFASSPIPEYKGRLAWTLDNVLTPEECTQLIALAESSVPDDETPWQPALIRLTPGNQVRSRAGYRESGRILWHDQTVVDRIWERCSKADGLQDKLNIVPQQYGKVREGEWQFRRVNERMSFLKYGPGQFFKPHCDGPYFFDTDETEWQTHYTLQLYLNDSAADPDDNEGLIGGATAFLSRDKTRKLDVNPKAGSILIFQHEGLLHEGSEVKQGTKYTLRTDILYEWVRDKKEQK